MEATKKSEFDKVLSAWDILVIAFGAMIGWGWVVSTGDWIQKGGVAGAMLGFVIGGIMVFFVGLTYAELTSAMPQCGGEHVFSFKAMGPIGSFICTWAIVLGYVSVVCFEACALPTIITYLYPDFLQGYLYSVAGFDIYASWLAVAIIVSVLITYINIIGAKTAAILQTVLTVVIGGVGILLIASAALTGNSANLDNQIFMGASTGDMLKSTLAVAVMTPFYFIGFDVIPQAAEEITVSLKKIGRILILSIVLAVLFYALIIGGVGYVMNNSAIALSMKSAGGLVTADAMAVAFGSSMMAKVLIIGGLCGIITSWNSFLIGGSRAMYSMAESYMIPRIFAKLHEKYKTPINALLLIGLLSVIAPFFGRKMLVWVVDAGNFGCCLAYCLVSVSFIILRTKEPDMARPYKVRHYKIVGICAVIMSGFMVAMYMIPGSGAALVPQEWAMVLGWSILGVMFGGFCKAQYGVNFATHIDVALDSAADEERDFVFGQAMAAALQDVQSDGPVTYAVRPINFSFCMPVNMVFGSGKSRKAGSLLKSCGKKALVVTDTSTRSIGTFLDGITDSFTAVGLSYSVFAHAGGNITNVMTAAGAEKAKQESCDFVVAVGGSEVMACAKSIAYAVSNGTSWPDRSIGRQKEALPLAFIPTSYDIDEGCSMVFAASDSEGNIKEFKSQSLLAGTVIVDPDCMKRMTKKEIATVGFAALCKNMDAFASRPNQPLVGAMALYGMSLLADNLPAVYEGTATRSVWEEVVLGSMIGSMTGYSTGNVLAEGMKRAAAFIQMDYMTVLPAIYPIVLETVYRSDIFTYGRLSRALGGFTAEDCAVRVMIIVKKLHLDMRLADLEIRKEDLTRMIDAYLKYAADHNIAESSDYIQVSQRVLEP